MSSRRALREAFPRMLSGAVMYSLSDSLPSLSEDLSDLFSLRGELPYREPPALWATLYPISTNPQQEGTLSPFTEEEPEVQGH